MSESTRIKLMEGIIIPPTPHIMIALNKELQRDDPEIDTLAELIQQDMSLAGKVLKTVNSPFFGIKSEVTSIQHALSLLGMSNIVNIVMGLVLRNQFDSADGNPPHFWDSPVNIALVSASLAKCLTSISEDNAYLTGLFHNAGHALINQKFPEYYDFLSTWLNDPEKTIAELEDEHYHFDHATIGYYMATSWGLNDQVSKVILHHHRVSEFLNQSNNIIDTGEELAFREALAILKLAEHIDHLFQGLEVDNEWERIKADVLGYLGLSDVDVEEIIDEMLEKLEINAR